MQTPNKKIIDAQSMTGTEVVNSEAVSLDLFVCCYLQAVWTGTPTGTFKVQTSGDPDDAPPTNWDDYPESEVAVAGAAGSQSWDIVKTGASWARLVYTNASGTGTLNARSNLKGN